MNNTPFWACATLCLASLVCPPAASAEEVRQSLTRAFYSEDVDCSGLLPGIPAASVPTPPRLPYGYRWDDYQGAEIEHDVYGDRQRVVRLAPLVPLGLAAARKFGGLFAIPCPRAGMPRSAPCLECQGADQPTDCGCEKPEIPLVPAPVPVPPTIVPPLPEEPTPAEPTVPPRNVVPRRIQPKTIPPDTIPPTTRHEVPSREFEPAPVRPPQTTHLEPVVGSAISLRLVPIQIRPAALRAGLPVAMAPEVRRNELQSNKLPVNSAKASQVSEKSYVGFGDFFYELLLGQRK